MQSKRLKQIRDAVRDMTPEEVAARLRQIVAGQTVPEPEQALDDKVTDAIIRALDKHYPGWKQNGKAEFWGMHMLDDDLFIRWTFVIGTADELGASVG